MRHAHLRAPFTPNAYTEAMTAADEAGFPVIVIDSTSHMWDGEGGILEDQDEIFQRLGGREANRMRSWHEAKKPNKRFVQRLLQVKAHVVLCFRAEDKIEMVKVGDKIEVRAKDTLTSILGWVPICERRLPFELTLSMLVLPSAPGVPKPIKLGDDFKPFFPLDQPISEESGRQLAEWARGGAAAPPTATVEPTDGEFEEMSFDAQTNGEGMSEGDFKDNLERAGISSQKLGGVGRKMFPGRSVGTLTDVERAELWEALNVEEVPA